MLKTIASLSLLFLFAQTGCSQELMWSEIISDIRKQHPEVSQLSTDSLAAWLNDENKAQPLLIDTREKEEYDVSHLAGAIQMNPNEENFSALAALDKNTPIVVYCSVGYRSSKIAEKLTASGFTNVANLEGSIFTWANDGYPLAKGNDAAATVHPYNKVWGMLLKKEYRDKH